MFEHYGDVHANGNVTQHSGDWAITREFMADYLASLAQVLIKDDELTQAIAYTFKGPMPKDDLIEFCSSVRYKTPKDPLAWVKPQYYSVKERKVSASDKFQHDKRYERVEEWNTGLSEAIMRMLATEYQDGIEVYARAWAIADWVSRHKETDVWIGKPGLFLKWFDNVVSDKKHAFAETLNDAFEAVIAVIDAYSARCQAERQVEGILRRTKPARCSDCGKVTTVNELRTVATDTDDERKVCWECSREPATKVAEVA